MNDEALFKNLIKLLRKHNASKCKDGYLIKTAYGDLVIKRIQIKNHVFEFFTRFKDKKLATNTGIYLMMDVNKFTGQWNHRYDMTIMCHENILKDITESLEVATTGENL